MTAIEMPADRAYQADLFATSESGRLDTAEDRPRRSAQRPKRARLQRKAAAAPLPAPGPLDQTRLDTLILARILAEPRGIERADISRDLAGLVAPWLDAETWRARLDRTLMSIADAGLITYRNSLAAMTDAGRVRSSLLIDAKGSVPKTWTIMRNQRIMALALGRSDLSAQRQALLAKPDGLRATIVETAFALKLKGAPTPTRLRMALAATALARAFGGKAPPKSDARQGLSPRAGRELAGQLFSTPRDPKTDKRLVADLAADVFGLATADQSALQQRLLHRYLAGLTRLAPPAQNPDAQRAAKPRRKSTRGERMPRASASAQATADQMQPEAAKSAALPIERPDIEKFVVGVTQAAKTVAEGWAGNRKAFISRVADAVRIAHPRWGLADVEFKAMLAEAHRLGRIVLATVDLRTSENLTDVQASQLTFKNTHFHLIRVEG
jgi:hypothetical protein